jgi:hypothetical protein
MAKTSRSRSGATGPRTPAGKMRSSQNSRKHGIFSKVSSEQQENLEILCDSVCEEMQAQGLVEQQICRQIGQNLAERERIEIFSLRGAKPIIFGPLTNVDEILKRESGWFRPRAPQGTPEGYQCRMRPNLCYLWLTMLKCEIENRGLDLEGDMAMLRRIYGDEPTPIIETIAVYYARVVGAAVQAAETLSKEDTKLVLDQLEREIDIQRMRSKLELASQAEDSMEPLAFPPDLIMDRILRYRAANGREFGRLLASYETLRRLKAASRAPLSVNSIGSSEPNS